MDADGVVVWLTVVALGVSAPLGEVPVASVAELEVEVVDEFDEVGMGLGVEGLWGRCVFEVLFDRLPRCMGRGCRGCL